MDRNVDDRNLTRRAVVYARSASAQPEDRGGIARQVARCRRLADELGVHLIREFADAGSSGLQRHRTGLQRLLTYVEASPIDYVICVDVVRLSRDYRQFQELTKRLSVLSVRLVTPEAPDDRAQPCLPTGG